MEKIEFLLGKIEQHLSNIDERLEKIETHSIARDAWQNSINVDVHACQTLIDEVMLNGCRSNKHSLKGVFAYTTILFTILAILMTFFSLKTKSKDVNESSSHSAVTGNQ